MSSFSFQTRLLTITAFLLLLSNCGPAKLQGSFDSAETNLLGSQVDVQTLLKSPSEPAENVLFRSPSQKNEVSYSLGAPLFENIVLKRDDFSRIIWVHESSQTIVGVGSHLTQGNFSANSAGSYSVFGYRGESPFLLTRFQMFERTSPGLPLTSDGVVQLSKTLISSDRTTDFFFITVDAPAVDLTSIELTVASTGSMTKNQRAALIQKSSTESVNVNVKLTDTSGQSSIQILNLPATATPSAAICIVTKEGGFGNLVCPSEQFIRQIDFASYGTPTGTCGSFQMGTCNSTTTMDIVKSNCLNKANCSFSASNGIFGDPCSGATKYLMVQATCAY